MRYEKSPRWRTGAPITNPLVRFGDLLTGRRILWLDPHPQNNGFAYSFVQEAAMESGRAAPVVSEVATADDALREIAANSYDLVLSHWGAGAGHDTSGEPSPAAVQLLQGIRPTNARVPVIIFASQEHVEARTREAKELGAADYCYTFDELFKSIEVVLTESGTEVTQINPA